MAYRGLCIVLSLALSFAASGMEEQTRAQADAETNWRTYYRTRTVSPFSGKTLEELLYEAIQLGATHEDLRHILYPHLYTLDDYRRIKDKYQQPN